MISEEANSIHKNELNDQKVPSETSDDTAQPFYEGEEDEWDQEDDSEEEQHTPSRRKWFKKAIAILLAILLFGNLIAFLPQIYNLPAIRFLNKDSELSQNEQIQQYKQAVVVVNANDRKGTGFNIAASGLIITNQHVMKDDKLGSVRFLHGKTYVADVIVSDTALDVAILKIRDNENNLPTLELETETPWQAGSPIHVIGNPLSFNQIANEGTVLGLTSLDNRELPVLMIQAPIHKGNSGSPVINQNGKVIAVVFATSSMKQGDQSIDIGLAIPVDHLQRYLESN